MSDKCRRLIFLTGAKISPVEFWSEHTYTDEKEERKYCYRFLTERQMSPSELKSLFYLLTSCVHNIILMVCTGSEVIMCRRAQADQKPSIL